MSRLKSPWRSSKSKNLLPEILALVKASPPDLQKLMLDYLDEWETDHPEIRLPENTPILNAYFVPTKNAAVALDCLGPTLIDLRGKKKTRRIQCPNYGMMGLSPDGSHVSFKLNDRNFFALVNLKKREKKVIIHNSLRGTRKKEIRKMAWSSDGKIIATGSSDATVKLFDPVHKQTIRMFNDHEKSIDHIAFAHHNARIVSASADGVVKIWNAKTGVTYYTLSLPQKRTIDRLKLSPDTSTLLCTQGKTMALWNIASGKSIETRNDTSPDKVEFSPSGHEVVFSSNDGHFRIWRYLDRSTHVYQPISKDQTNIPFSANGAWTLTHDDEYIALIDLKKKEIVRGFSFLEEHQQIGQMLFVDPQGSEIVSAHANGVIRFWNTHTGSNTRRIHSHNNFIGNIQLSHDACLVMTRSQHELSLWTNRKRLFAAYLAKKSPNR